MLYEMCDHKKPFAQYDAEHFTDALVRGVRPKIRPQWPRRLQQLLADCWESDTEKRPEFRVILAQLEALAIDVDTEAGLSASRASSWSLFWLLWLWGEEGGVGASMSSRRGHLLVLLLS